VVPEPELEPGTIVRYIQEQLLEAQLSREAEGTLPLFEVEGLEVEMRVYLSTRKAVGGKVGATPKKTILHDHRAAQAGGGERAEPRRERGVPGRPDRAGASANRAIGAHGSGSTIV